MTKEWHGSLTVVIARTHQKNIVRVIERAVHALYGRPRGNPDIMLIAKVGGLIEAAMWIKEIRPTTPGETEAVWNGQRWPWWVKGEGCCKLDTPFHPQEEKVTSVPIQRFLPSF